MSEISDHSLAPESLFALTVQCRDWLDHSASSEGDDFEEKEEEAEKVMLPDHRPLDVIIAQMVRAHFSEMFDSYDDALSCYNRRKR